MFKLLLVVTTDKDDGWRLPLLWPAIPSKGDHFQLSFRKDGETTVEVVDTVEHNPEKGHIVVEFYPVHDWLFAGFDRGKVSEDENEVPWIHHSNNSLEHIWKPIPFFKSCIYSDA